jgi:hypothetical protein
MSTIKLVVRFSVLFTHDCLIYSFVLYKVIIKRPGYEHGYLVHLY